MKTLDRIFGWLMVVAALLHMMGSYSAYNGQPKALLWADSAGLGEIFLAALNLLRAGRPEDRTLASVCVGGTVAWLTATFIFGRLIGNVFDFRVLIQASITVALLVMSIRTWIFAARSRRPAIKAFGSL